MILNLTAATPAITKPIKIRKFGLSYKVSLFSFFPNLSFNFEV